MTLFIRKKIVGHRAKPGDDTVGNLAPATLEAVISRQSLTGSCYSTAVSAGPAAGVPGTAVAVVLRAFSAMRADLPLRPRR